MPTRHEVPVDATDWIAAVEQIAQTCRPGDTLVVHSFAQEALAEQILRRLGLESQVTLVSTGKRIRFFVADTQEQTPSEMAQRIHDHLTGLKDRAARADPPVPPTSDDE